MTKQLTQEIANKYLENGGNTCPYCGSDNISGGSVSMDSGGAWQEVDCNECEETWTDDYTLTSVMDEKKIHFALRIPPSVLMTVEEQPCNNFQEDRLYVTVMANKPGEDLYSAVLRESVFTTDEMTEENFNEFLE